MDTSKFLKNADLDNLKSDVDKLDLDKVETNPVNLTLKRLVRGEGRGGGRGRFYHLL